MSETPIKDRLDELQALPVGWHGEYDPASQPLTDSARRRAESWMRRIRNDLYVFADVFISPLPDGGCDLEYGPLPDGTGILISIPGEQP